MVFDRGVIHQTLAATCVLSNAFMRGMIIGWVAPTLAKLKHGDYDFSATDRELSWVASAQSAGRFFGPMLMAVTMDTVGRKSSLMMGCYSLLILWVLMFFVRSITLLIMLRLLMGAILGMFDVVNWVYLAENCSPKMRGIIGSLNLLSSNIGVLVETILTTYLSFSTASAVNATISLCLAATTMFLKETPYFLVMKGRHEEAKQNLLWLRGKNASDNDVIEELDKIQQNMQSEMLKKRSFVKTLKRPENYEPILLIVICTSLIISGNIAIGAYSSLIFQPLDNFSSNEFTILMSVCDLLSSLIFPLIVEKFNRRTLLLMLMLIVAICNVYTFILHSLKSNAWKKMFSWAIFSTVTFQYLVNGWAVFVILIVSGELLPMSVKGVGSCLGVMTSSIVASIVTAIFWPISVTFGIQYNCVLFLIANIIVFMYIYKALPETKGKTLVNIQLSLQSSSLRK